MADSRLAGPERARPEICRSFGLNCLAGFDPKRSLKWDNVTALAGRYIAPVQGSGTGDGATFQAAGRNDQVSFFCLEQRRRRLLQNLKRNAQIVPVRSSPEAQIR